MTDQLAAEQQHGNLVAVALPACRIPVDVDDVDCDTGGRGQGLELSEQLLAQAAVGARVQQESRPDHGVQWCTDSLAPAGSPPP